MKKKSFNTSNFYLASFLYVKGIELVGIDRTDPRRSQFVFNDTPERENIVQAFNFAGEDAEQVRVDARKMITAIKQLKDKLYQTGERNGSR